MKLKVFVFLRPRTVKILLARKDKPWGGQKWLAEQLGISEAFVSMMLNGKAAVPSGKQSAVINAFRGMSHKRGGRVSWDDLFQQSVLESTGASI